MYACYRRDDAFNPDVFLTAAAAILSEFPERVIEYVTDPRTGLQGRLKWPPQPSEVKEACVERMAYLRKIEAEENALDEQFRKRDESERLRAEAPKADRVNAILAKHGFSPLESRGRKQGHTRDSIAEGRKELEALCEREGIDPKVICEIPNAPFVYGADEGRRPPKDGETAS